VRRRSRRSRSSRRRPFMSRRRGCRRASGSSTFVVTKRPRSASARLYVLGRQMTGLLPRRAARAQSGADIAVMSTTAGSASAERDYGRAPQRRGTSPTSCGRPSSTSGARPTLRRDPADSSPGGRGRRRRARGRRGAQLLQRPRRLDDDEAAGPGSASSRPGRRARGPPAGRQRRSALRHGIRSPGARAARARAAGPPSPELAAAGRRSASCASRACTACARRLAPRAGRPAPPRPPARLVEHWLGRGVHG